MPTITVANHKGGTGKTITTLNLAAALAMSGNSVLALDPQGFLTHFLGCEEPAPVDSSWMLFQEDSRYGELSVRPTGHFDLIPSCQELVNLPNRLDQREDVHQVRDRLSGFYEYDWIFIDTAAAVTAVSVSAMVAARRILIPVIPEYQGITGAHQTIETCRSLRNAIGYPNDPPFLLCTQMDARKRQHSKYEEYLRHHFADRVFDQVIRTNSCLSETRAEGDTVFDRAPHSRGARDYANAADELINRLRPARTHPVGEHESRERQAVFG